MKKQNDHSEDALDALFAQATRDAPVPSPDLLARIAQDADRVQSLRSVPPKLPLWRFALGEIGGLPATAGLVSATLVGLYLGFADPTLLDSVTLDQDGLDYVGYFPADGLAFYEGLE